MTIAVFAVGCLLVVGGASAAVVKIENLVLRADGGFEPQTLPRRAFAPIDFRGHFDIGARNGGTPAALQRVVLEFDRDGRLDTRGLPTCSVEQVAEASPREARTVCKGAIVGTGHVSAMVALPGQAPVLATSPLTLFNGVPQNGNPTVVMHAQVTVPATQTLAIVVPIERLHGPYSYRATVDLPPIAGGYASLTHADARIGRRYSAGGQRLSYASAHCGSGVFQTHGSFTFAGDTTISGSVYEACRVRRRHLPILAGPGR